VIHDYTGPNGRQTISNGKLFPTVKAYHRTGMVFGQSITFVTISVNYRITLDETQLIEEWLLHDPHRATCLTFLS